MRIDIGEDVVTQGRRKLREMFIAEPMASTSVTTAATAPVDTTVDEEKTLQARARREAGPVKRTFDPASFEWVEPGTVRNADKPTMTVTAKGLYIVASAKERWLQEWINALVVVGFAPRAIALRKATGRGFRLRPNTKTKYRIALSIQSKVVHDEAVKRGFPARTILEVRYDQEHDMIVGIKGKEIKGKEG